MRVGDIRGDVYSKETEREEQIWICILLKTKKSEYKHIIICIHFVICLLTPQLFHTHAYRLCLLLTKPGIPRDAPYIHTRAYSIIFRGINKPFLTCAYLLKKIMPYHHNIVAENANKG